MKSLKNPETGELTESMYIDRVLVKLADGKKTEYVFDSPIDTSTLEYFLDSEEISEHDVVMVHWAEAAQPDLDETNSVALADYEIW